MNIPNDQLQLQPLPSALKAFETFKRQALNSLMWGCVGFFLLGMMVGLMLSR